MSAIERVYNQFPPPRLWRRGVATTIDFVLAWLLSLVGINPQATVQLGQLLIFAVAWLGLRVLMAAQNQGQSPGHWAMDMKVVDYRNRTPGLLELMRREGSLGLGALLGLIGLSSLYAGFVMFLLLIPLAIDCGWAWSDWQRQTLHDRFSRTLVVHTYRGFSLDLKVGRLLAKRRQDMR